VLKLIKDHEIETKMYQDNANDILK